MKQSLGEEINRGRLIEGRWVVGGIERKEDGDDMFVALVRARNKSTAVIERFVRPSTEIHTNEWRGYYGLEERGYTHKTVNHSKNFVNPAWKNLPQKQRYRTQRIESM